MQIFKDRVPYTAIVDRPPLKLPNGKRMAVWFIANVEDWDISRPMPVSYTHLTLPTKA